MCDDPVLLKMEEILTELRALRADLRAAIAAGPSGRTPPLLAGASRSADPLDPGEGPDVDPNSQPVVDWLAARGIQVRTMRGDEPADDVYDWLATYLGRRFDNLRPLHDVIRRSLAKSRSFTLSLAGAPPGRISDTTQLCTKLLECAFLTHYYYDRNARRVFGTVQASGHVINFFTGGWFERYVRILLHQAFDGLVSDRALLSNAQVVLPGGHDFELDLLALLDGQPLWIECKTGDYQEHIDHYSRTRAVLGVPPDRSILVVLGLPDDLIETLTRLYDLRLANQHTLEGLLRATIAPLNEPATQEDDTQETGSLDGT